MYKRPEDQYKVSKVKETIEELNKKIPCHASTVITYKVINFGNGPHAGVLTHICGLEKGHSGRHKCGNCDCQFLVAG